MTHHTKIMALIAGAALALAGTGFAAQSTPSAPAAQPPAKAAKRMTGITRGRIKSISGSQIVVERRLKSSAKERTFALDASTQKQGDPKTGDRVIVHYRRENNQDVATMVRVAKGKAGKD